MATSRSCSRAAAEAGADAVAVANTFVGMVVDWRRRRPILGGVTGGLAGFPGALVTIWCSLKGWDKWQQRCVYQPFILIMQILALCLIMLMGPPAGHQSGLHALAYTPGALVGAACGLAIFDRLSDRQFAVAANLSLIIAGVGLLVR